ECYYRGERGVEKNEEEYLKWITRSAEGGYSNAYFSLGLYYKDKNKQQAIKWFKKCADAYYLSDGESDEYASEQLRELGVEYNPEDNNTTYTADYTSEQSSVGDIDLVKATYAVESTLAIVNYQEGEYKKAIKAYSEIIDKYENSIDCSDAYLGRALALLRQEKYEEANKDLIYLQNNSNTPEDIKETSSKLLLKSQQILAEKNKTSNNKNNQWLETLSLMFNAINTGMQGAPTYNYQNSTSRPTVGTKKVTCSYCKGKGWVAGSGTATYGLNNSYWCNECNEEVNASHSHDRCPSCNGTGYNSKITYE
ncbi:MAG: hypothetical protein IJZ17_01795, partial [Muribaculaceae bacterium]|nr:hypothetical protein [Muribaculaceae bacterium]